MESRAVLTVRSTCTTRPCQHVILSATLGVTSRDRPLYCQIALFTKQQTAEDEAESELTSQVRPKGTRTESYSSMSFEVQ